jgi:hypothetical protein
MSAILLPTVATATALPATLQAALAGAAELAANEKSGYRSLSLRGMLVIHLDSDCSCSTALGALPARGAANRRGYGRSRPAQPCGLSRR